jgi:hypothetical protein
MADAMTAQEQADAFLAEYMAWVDKKQQWDNKRVESILKAWGF